MGVGLSRNEAHNPSYHQHSEIDADKMSILRLRIRESPTTLLEGGVSGNGRDHWGPRKNLGLICAASVEALKGGRKCRVLEFTCRVCKCMFMVRCSGCTLTTRTQPGVAVGATEQKIRITSPIERYQVQDSKAVETAFSVIIHACPVEWKKKEHAVAALQQHMRSNLITLHPAVNPATQTTEPYKPLQALKPKAT